jgi:hypothetical protein
MWNYRQTHQRLCKVKKEVLDESKTEINPLLCNLSEFKETSLHLASKSVL